MSSFVEQLRAALRAGETFHKVFRSLKQSGAWILTFKDFKEEALKAKGSLGDYDIVVFEKEPIWKAQKIWFSSVALAERCRILFRNAGIEVQDDADEGDCVLVLGDPPQ